MHVNQCVRGAARRWHESEIFLKRGFLRRYALRYVLHLALLNIYAFEDPHPNPCILPSKAISWKEA